MPFYHRHTCDELAFSTIRMAYQQYDDARIPAFVEKWHNYIDEISELEFKTASKPGKHISPDMNTDLKFYNILNNTVDLPLDVT